MFMIAASSSPLFVAVSWLQYSANKTGNQQRGGWISPPFAFFWPNVVLHRPSSSALLSICQPASNRTKPHHRLLSAYQWPLKHHSPKTTMYLASLSLSLSLSLPPIRVCSIIHSFPLKGINSTFVFPYPRLYAAAAAQGVRRLRWTESANDKCVPVQPTRRSNFFSFQKELISTRNNNIAVGYWILVLGTRLDRPH